MSNNKLSKLLAEKEKRSNPPDLLSAAFPHQRDFILDPCRLKAALVARRSGKSFMIGIYLLYTALQNPMVKCLYFGKTQDAARNIMWLHIIFVLCERFQIECKYNKSLQEVTLANGSIIKLTGADASDTQIEKALGGKYKLCVFDECQVISHDLERWVKDRLGPAMVDEQGTIVMAGTTGDYMGDRFWYKVTKTDGLREVGWNVHTWKWFDNPFMKDLIKKELDAKIALEPLIETTPGFRQEWLCEWVIDRESRIYKYNSERNALTDPDLIKSLLSKDKKWKYIIGLDFGYEDPNAIVVGAFFQHDPNCYIVDSFKKNHMEIDEIAALIQDWKESYNPVYIVGDAQDKIVIKTLQNKFRIPIVPADKRGKFSHIVNMNSDFLIGKIKVIEINNKPLLKEWEELNWNEIKKMQGIYEECQSKDNHLADSCLYMHNFSKHYRATSEPKPPEGYSQFRLQAEKALEERLAEKTYELDTYSNIEDLMR